LDRCRAHDAVLPSVDLMLRMAANHNMQAAQNQPALRAAIAKPACFKSPGASFKSSGSKTT
jgi:hypothetical protein